MHIPYPYQTANQRGDTIVEVIIALAVISSVLIGAFFLTNRSSQYVRDSEEHAQALQLLQGQIEQVRAQATAPGATIADFPSSNFCYDATGVQQVTAGATDFTKCPDDVGGSSGVAYNFVITKTTPAANTMRLFTAYVQWEGLHGQTNSQKLLYKINIP